MRNPRRFENPGNFDVLRFYLQIAEIPKKPSTISLVNFGPDLQKISENREYNCIHAKMFDEVWLNFECGAKGAEVWKSCRSRQELSNEYLLAKFGVDTAENGSIYVCQNSP